MKEQNTETGVLDTLPKKLQAEARELLTKIPYAETRAEAERLKRGFQAWATKRHHVITSNPRGSGAGRRRRRGAHGRAGT